MNNSTTLQSYNDNLQAYIDGTPVTVEEAGLKGWINAVLSQLTPGDTILEIGSGFGRDADYIESQGFSVERTDAAEAFVTLMQSQGHEAHILNVLTDPIEGAYSLIFAVTVFLHFTENELHTVLDKVHGALKQGGILAFTLKQGDGEEWSDTKLGAPRYFKYWQPEALREVMEAHGFGDIQFEKDVDRPFLRVVARSK